MAVRHPPPDKSPYVRAESRGRGGKRHAFHKGLAVAKQLNVGRIVSKIDSDGAVFAGLFGCCAHGHPQVIRSLSADETRWGSHVVISRQL